MRLSDNQGTGASRDLDREPFGSANGRPDRFRTQTASVPALHPRSRLPEGAPRATLQLGTWGSSGGCRIRVHLGKLENVHAANLFRAHELDFEREAEGFFNRFLSCLYSCVSRYGTATWKPFAWFLALLATSFLIVFLSDGAVPNVSSENEVGWKQDLPEDSVVWSGILAIKSIVGPLLLFDSKPSVVPREPWLLFSLFFLGLAQAGCLFMFFLALRRRFRMHDK